MSVSEFPFVAALPKREKPRFVKMWDDLAAMRRAFERHGVLIPPAMAADLAGVSRQRIFCLVEDGLLTQLRFNGRVFITGDSFANWATSERKNGHRLKEPPVGKWRFGLELGKAWSDAVTKP